MGDLRQARNGERGGRASEADALDRLYRTHSSWLLRVLARRFAHASLDLDGLVQDAFIRVGRYVAGERARHPRALLFNIAANLARDELRRDLLLPAQSDPALLPFADRAIEDDRLEILLMKQLIIGMPRKYRDVFLLSRFSGLNNEEIARHLGISIKTVEWRMSKALSLCATVLGD